jgi:hypothetical protein
VVTPEPWWTRGWRRAGIFRATLWQGEAWGWFVSDYVYAKRHNLELDKKLGAMQNILAHLRIAGPEFYPAFHPRSITPRDNCARKCGLAEVREIYSGLMRKDLACGIILLTSAGVWAQVPTSQAQILRGAFLEGDARVEAGEFSIRVPGNEVLRYRFDAKTRVTRGGLATTFSLLRPGEPVEVDSSPIPESPLRYANSILTSDPLPTPRSAPRPRMRTMGSPSEPQFQRGELTFSGVVAYLADGRLILHTRNSGEQTILLRQDTRFLAGGDIVGSSDLKANMRVFVRAGKDLFGHTEAYQVMWGGFLQPHLP